ncbi:MAG: sugar transferase [Verrucomicrobia bacterium]|nr:MAG: sugar transferase [Verrucomicrobiota bacterium]
MVDNPITSHGRRGPVMASTPIPRWKFAFDWLWMVLILPLTLVLTSLLFCWVKLASPGPFIFRQTRIGRDGKPFTMYKARTMQPGADPAIHEAHILQLVRSNRPLTKLDSRDGRLIKGARVIRMLGLDELPQLVNVLRGDMSVVGPRPCIPSEFQLYDAHHHRRFAVRPGLTGLWQIQRTEATTFSEMAGMDLEYVDRLSAWSDCKIIMKTPLSMIKHILTSVRSAGRKPRAWRSGQSSV